MVLSATILQLSSGKIWGKLERSLLLISGGTLGAKKYMRRHLHCRRDNTTLHNEQCSHIIKNFLFFLKNCDLKLYPSNLMFVFLKNNELSSNLRMHFLLFYLKSY